MKYYSSPILRISAMSLPSWECGLKFRQLLFQCFDCSVTPFMGVWIEISRRKARKISDLVTPFMGVWIEIRKGTVSFSNFCVTPFMGVWIEMTLSILHTNKCPVTPFVGVWIEIYLYMMLVHKLKRHCVGVWIRI